jgi:AcrR family transcriptional regulator
MARTAGARNADFVQRRKALIDKARLRLSSQDGGVPSFRELALAAGVSVPTLRHYFGTREALVKAVFTNALEGASVHLQRARSADHVGEALEPALVAFLQRVVKGWTTGQVGSLHRIGLAEGLRNPGTGLDYLVDVLEPTLQALETRLRSYVSQRVIAECDPRQAGLMLLSPIILALLHQHDLGGTRCRPLDINALIDEHVRVFARAYRAE